MPSVKGTRGAVSLKDYGLDPADYQKILRFPERPYSVHRAFDGLAPEVDPAKLPEHPASMRIMGRINQLQTAYYESGGQVPVSWFAGLPTADLDLLTSAPAQDRLQPTLFEIAQQAALNRHMKLQLEADAEEIYQQNLETQRLAKGYHYTPDDVQFNIAGELLPGQKFDKNAWESALKKHFDVKNTSGYEVVKSGFQLLGQLFQLGISTLGPFLDVYTLDPSFSNSKSMLHVWFGSPQEEDLSPATKEFQAHLQEQRSGLLRDEDKNRLFQQAILPGIAEQVRTDSPELWNELVQMYGDEESARLGIMVEAMDIQQHPDVDEQLGQWVDSMYRENEQLADEMEAADFFATSDAVAGLNTYGQIVMGAASGLTVLFTSEDARALVGQMKWEEAWQKVAQEAEAGGHTPSGVLGLEGTLAGMMADFALGSAVDPTVWFFGLKGNIGVNGLASEAAVESRLASPAMKIYNRLTPRDIVSVGRTELGKANMVAPYLEVGLGPELLETVGQMKTILPGEPWLKHPLGRKARYTPMKYIEEFTDELSLAGSSEAAIEGWEASLRNNGFKRPIKLEYSPTDGRIIFRNPDDINMYLAAKRIEGVNDIPATVQVLPERIFVDPKPTQIPKKILRHPDDYVYHGTSRAGDLDFLDKGGLTGDRTRAEQYSAGVKVVKEDGSEVVFLRDDLPHLRPGENVQQGLLDLAVDYMRENNIRGRIEEMPRTVYAIKRSSLPPEIQELLATGDLEEISGVVLGPVEIAERYTIHPDGGGEIPFQFPAGVPEGKTFDPASTYGVDTLDIEGAQYAQLQDFFGPEALPKADIEGFTNLSKEVLMRGGDLPPARQTWAAVGLGRIFRDFVRGGWDAGMSKYLRTSFNRNFMRIKGAGGRKVILDQMQFLAADHPEFLNHWMARVIENERQLGAVKRQLAGVAERLGFLRTMEQRIAEQLPLAGPDLPRLIETMGDPEMVARLQDKKLSYQEMGDIIQGYIKNEYQTMEMALHEELGTQTWGALWREFEDTFNREFIATNPQWAKDVGPDGLVPWSKIHRGVPGGQPGAQPSPITPQGVQLDSVTANVATQLGLAGDAARILSQWNRYGLGEVGVEMRATPIEMLAATELGGARYTKWTHNAWINEIRKFGASIHQVWLANVLLTPRTFIVMSADELSSMFHGLPGSRLDYLDTRIQKWNARFRGGAYKGQRHLGPRAQELLRGVLDAPLEFRQYRQGLADVIEQGTVTMNWGDVGYKEAAITWSVDTLSNPAFRQFLEGAESFKHWFETTTEGMEFQFHFTVKDGKRQRPLRNWEEAHQMVNLIWETIVAKAREAGIKGTIGEKGSPIQDYLDSWRDVAQKWDNDAGGRQYAMPEWTWRYFGELEGVKPIYPGRSMAWDAISRMYEKGAAEPSFFRQGIIGRTVRESELARLKSLRQDLPLHKQMPNASGELTYMDLINLLQARGLPLTLLDDTFIGVLDELLAEQGLLTDSWIGRLAERRAYDAIDDMTYSFEEGSRAGLGGRAVAPFGRAWGEMYGRWGRNLAAITTVRPMWNRVPFLRGVLNGIAMWSPVNLRTASFLSRFAAMDMNINQGFVGEGGGLIPGTTGTDFNPLTFLPTKGNGGVGVLLPGLGPFPTAGLGDVLKYLGPDPIEDPQGYEQMIDSISQYLPSARFANQDIITQFLGGGNLGLMWSTLGDIQTGLFHRTYREGGYLSGTLGREIERNRQVSAVLANPELLDDILNSEDPDEVLALLAGVNLDADSRAAGAHALETTAKWLVPSKTYADQALDEIYNVWIQAGRQFDELAEGTRLGDLTDDELRRDPDLLRRVGDTIRKKYFDLAPWERDLILAKDPALGVNLIGGWQWGLNLPEGIPDTDRPYEVRGGSPSELDRHSFYASEGYIVPRDSQLRGFQVIGRIIDARFGVATMAYESQAKYLNDFRWDNGLVSDETKQYLDFLLTLPELKRLGYTDSKALWRDWGQLSDDAGAKWATDLGLEPDTDEYADFLSKIRIPTKDEAWGETWRSDMPDDFSQRFKELRLFEFAPEVQRIADVMGFDIEPGMTGQEFLDIVTTYKRENEGAAWNAVRYEYDKYVSERGRDVSQALATMNDLSQKPSLDDSFKEAVKEFSTWAELQADRNYREGDLPRNVQEEAVDRFQHLRTAGRDAPVNWDMVWRDGFESLFGPWDWEPPEPPSLVDEGTGKMNQNAWRPVVVGVVDGDTLQVSKNVGPSIISTDSGVRALETPGTPRYHNVRLLGVMAADYGLDTPGANRDRNRLVDALQEAYRNGDSVWLVRDPDYTGSPVDAFGRELAWLYIGDKPYWFPSDLTRSNS